MSTTAATQHGISNLGENQCPIRQLSNFDGLPLREWKEDVRAHLKAKGLIDYLNKDYKPKPKGLFNPKKQEELKKYIEQFEKWKKDRGCAFALIMGSLKEGSIAKTVTMKLQKEDKKGEKLFPILELWKLHSVDARRQVLCSTWKGCARMSNRRRRKET